MVPGHEFSAEIGTGVNTWAPGDLVSVAPRLCCGQCLSCGAGLESLCARSGFLGVRGADGGLAKYCVAPAYGLYRLPDGCSPLQAACVEAACCATWAVRSGMRSLARTWSSSVSCYNLYAIQWLKGHGATIVAVDPVATRCQAALGFGADVVIDPASEKVSARLRTLMPFGADVVFVALEDYVAEAESYVELAHRAARVQGTVMMRSYGSAPFARMQPMAPWLKELTIRHFGNFFGNEPARGGRDRGDWQLTLDAIAQGTLSAPPPQHQVIAFSDLCDEGSVAVMFDRLPNEATKIIVDMSR